ncbi:MAG: DUF1593 domain-containing protein [Bryobacteraceae bacterium]|nr:DUF1593 domain-containing protein [Bryobacteraceae bacterium]
MKKTSTTLFPPRTSAGPPAKFAAHFRLAAALLALLAGPLWIQPLQAQPAPPDPRPRVIVTTDGEIDDRCSFIRFLTYANEFNIEGMIYSSSRFHWLGHTWSGVEWIHAQIELYSRVYDNLKKHADGWPSPDELRSKVYVGNISNVGEMELDTPGADRIVKVLLDDQPGSVYLQAWGGTNTIAKALAKIQKEHPDQMDKVSRKAVIYIIHDQQDETFRKYIEPNWPKLQVLVSIRQFGAIAYDWRRLIPLPHRIFFERPWLVGNVISDRGPLAGAYESENGAFRSEGDSPSFMHQIEVGLRSLEHPSYGGWGGRFVEEKPGVTNVWRDAQDDGDVYKPIWRWAEAFQRDWAARADWCVKPYREANHPPVIRLAVPKDIAARPGSTVRLSVAGSSDPDGDTLRYSWWQYREPGSYPGEVSIQDASSATALLQVPADAKPSQTIHLIAEVTDTGKPPLTRYARVIVTVQ